MRRQWIIYILIGLLVVGGTLLELWTWGTFSPGIKVHTRPDTELDQEKLDNDLKKIREMREEQTKLRQELPRLHDLLDQYERGTLKSA